MALKPADEIEETDSSSSDNSSSSSNKSSSSSSSSSSSDEFPKYKKVCPQAVIRKPEMGDWEGLKYPNTPEIRLRKDWYTAPWKVDEPRIEWENWQKYWVDEQSWDYAVHMVKEELSLDLNKLLREDPEKAAKATTQAAQKHNVEQPKKKHTRTCPVCDNRINPATDDCREIGNNLVCSRHNVEELHQHGLLD